MGVSGVILQPDQSAAIEIIIVDIAGEILEDK
jgi:hypothetical protein